MNSTTSFIPGSPSTIILDDKFTTGSSQLPPGGFGDLKPLFQIAPTHKKDSLPIAHTCFNMICLSDHSSFQSFERALLIAINDDSEGFELA